jgi:predicted MFS family arabinose efflux permease
MATEDPFVSDPHANTAIDPRRAYWALAILFAMNLLNYIDRYVLGAVLGPVRDSLHIDQGQAGWLGSAFMISYTVVSPFMGWLGDRVTRKYLLAAGVGLWSLATFGSGMAETFGQMMIARSLMGIGEATYAVIAPTLIGDMFPRGQRSRALAVFYVAIPIGAALGYVIGGYIEAHWGWQWAFRVVGLPGLVVALGALALYEPERGASEMGDGRSATAHAASLPLSWSTYADLGTNRSFVINTLAMAMMTFALGGLVLYTPDFLSSCRGMPLDKANYWLGPVIAISGLVGTAMGGWLGDRLARRVRGAYFLVAGVSSLSAVPFIAIAIVAKSPAVILACMGVGLTLIFLNTGPSNAIITNVTPPQVRAAAFAINIFCIHLLGDIPSPPLMGYVGNWTGSMVWGMTVAVPTLALSGVLYLWGARYLDADQEAVIAISRPEAR